MDAAPGDVFACTRQTISTPRMIAVTAAAAITACLDGYGKANNVFTRSDSCACHLGQLASPCCDRHAWPLPVWLRRSAEDDILSIRGGATGKRNRTTFLHRREKRKCHWAAGLSPRQRG